MHSLNTALGFGESEKAAFKLHCIEFFAKHRWKAFHDGFPQVSRSTIFRWQKQYLASGKRLNVLVPQSTRPKTKRQMAVKGEILDFLRSMRQQYPHLSKYKLKPFLDAFCEKQGLSVRSVSWIGKVLSRYQLFFGSRQRIYRRRRSSRSGYMIKRTPNPNQLTLGYLQFDGVKVYWAGQKLLFLTAIELKTRWAWVKIVPTFSSFHARTFLEEIIGMLNFPIHSIHTDNGSEFKALFDAAILELELTHLWSPPRSPKIHSHIERFNGTLQSEFVDYHVDTAMVEPQIFRKQLQSWVDWYNTKRPHHSLKLLTPYQYLLNLQKGAESLKCP